MLILYFAPGASSMAVQKTIEIEQTIGYELPK